MAPDGNGSVIRQTATFDPIGRAGRLYWYALRPVHGWMFGGMLRRIGQLAVREGARQRALIASAQNSAP